MKKALKYGFTGCTLVYLLSGILLIVVFATLFRGSYQPIVDVENMSSILTLMLSEFSWWGGFYYLALLVPWLASCCLVTVAVYRFKGGASTRALLVGFSVFAYYFVMWIVFLVHGLIYGWGDMAYDLIWLWPLCAFAFGYAAANTLEKTLKLQLAG